MHELLKQVLLEKYKLSSTNLITDRFNSVFLHKIKQKLWVKSLTSKKAKSSNTLFENRCYAQYY